MTHFASLTLVLALGMRHGMDPDHLAVIDGLSWVHPSRFNGVLFAIGHGLFVTLLAVGVGSLLARLFEPYAPWILILVGVLNLWRVFRRVSPHTHRSSRLPTTSPLLLGVLFGAGFETASQLSAIVLAANLNPWLLGGVFSTGMLLVDGADGFLAAKVRRSMIAGNPRAVRGGQFLGLLVSVFSLALGAAELAGTNIDALALPLGGLLLATLVSVRLWGSGGRSQNPAGRSNPREAEEHAH